MNAIEYQPLPTIGHDASCGIDGFQPPSYNVIFVDILDRTTHPAESVFTGIHVRMYIQRDKYRAITEDIKRSSFHLPVCRHHLYNDYQEDSHLDRLRPRFAPHHNAA